MDSKIFSMRDRILALPILFAGGFCLLSLADGGAVVIPGASLGLIIITAPTSLWLFSHFYRRARPVHKLSLVFGIIALFMHPAITARYVRGWCEAPEFIVSKGIEREIPPESVLKAKIQRANDQQGRSFWTNRFIQHLYVNDLWERQSDHLLYILHPLSVALILLAIFIGLLSPVGDTVLIELFNPHGKEQDD